jgi:hypothetical protein
VFRFWIIYAKLFCFTFKFGQKRVKFPKVDFLSSIKRTTTTGTGLSLSHTGWKEQEVTVPQSTWNCKLWCWCNLALSFLFLKGILQTPLGQPHPQSAWHVAAGEAHVRHRLKRPGWHPGTVSSSKKRPPRSRTCRGCRTWEGCASHLPRPCPPRGADHRPAAQLSRQHPNSKKKGKTCGTEATTQAATKQTRKLTLSTIRLRPHVFERTASSRTTPIPGSSSFRGLWRQRGQPRDGAGAPGHGACSVVRARALVPACCVGVSETAGECNVMQ